MRYVQFKLIVTIRYISFVSVYCAAYLALKLFKITANISLGICIGRLLHLYYGKTHSSRINPSDIVERGKIKHEHVTYNINGKFSLGTEVQSCCNRFEARGFHFVGSIASNFFVIGLDYFMILGTGMRVILF